MMMTDAAALCRIECEDRTSGAWGDVGDERMVLNLSRDRRLELTAAEAGDLR